MALWLRIAAADLDTRRSRPSRGTTPRCGQRGEKTLTCGASCVTNRKGGVGQMLSGGHDRNISTPARGWRFPLLMITSGRDESKRRRGGGPSYEVVEETPALGRTGVTPVAGQPLLLLRHRSFEHGAATTGGGAATCRTSAGTASLDARGYGNHHGLNTSWSGATVDYHRGRRIRRPEGHPTAKLLHAALRLCTRRARQGGRTGTLWCAAPHVPHDRGGWGRPGPPRFASWSSLVRIL